MYYPSVLPFLITAALALPARDLLSKPRSKSFKLPLQRRSDGAVVSDNFGPIWVSPILVGGQELRMLVDTGSADLWLPSTELPDEQKGTHKLYDASSSSTAHKVDGQNFNINYSFPGASGYVVTDDVDIGGTIVQGMPVGVATKMGPYLVNQKDYDGILGLAFQGGNSIRPDQSKTFMEYAQSSLDIPVFTANLRPDNQDGTLEFGFIDHSLYSGDLNTVPVNNSTDGSWTVDQVTFAIGNVQITQQMLFDTGGANFMRVDAQIVNAYWAQVEGAISNDGSDWGFPCDVALPDFTLKIGDGSAIIPGKLMNAGRLSNAAPLPLCTGALQSTDPSASGSVGAPFFEAYFTVFNQADPSIQYAPHC